MAQAASDQAAAESAMKLATRNKNAARAALIGSLGMTAKGLEAMPAVTDAMLVAASLAPRPGKGVRPTSLDAPADLVASGTTDGGLTLKWSSTNQTRVSHVVEVSADGVTWSYLGTTTRTSLSALGFAPGVPVWARVFAVNATLSSPASNVASLYAPAAPALRLAA